MANYRYTVNGTDVVRTWNDGIQERFDTANYPENVQQYLLILATKERLGTGGVLAGNSDLSFDVQRKLAADEHARLLNGLIPDGRGGGWIPPTDEQLYEALVMVLNIEDDDEDGRQAIAKRVDATHPDQAPTDKEAKKRRKKLKESILASEPLREALREQGYTPPEPQELSDDLLAPIQ